MVSDNFTPIPSSFRIKESRKSSKILFFIALFIIGILVFGIFQRWGIVPTQFLQANDKKVTIYKLFASESPTPEISTQPIQVSDDYIGWSRKTSNICSMGIRIPPAQEPYMTPRDPNTLPSIQDDEGLYWVYDEFETKFFMMSHAVSVIYKNPQRPGSGYVSSGIDVYCAPNLNKFTSDIFFNTLQNNLIENYSIVKIASSIKTQMWGKDVWQVTFSGGSFNSRDVYYIFASRKNIYMVRGYGESENQEVINMRDKIMQSMEFK